MKQVMALIDSMQRYSLRHCVKTSYEWSKSFHPEPPPPIHSIPETPKF